MHTTRHAPGAQLGPQNGLPRRRLHLLYHELRAEPAAYSYVVGSSLFQQHLNLYRQVLQSNASLVPTITFDDGHVSNLTLAAPLLAEHQLSAHFFITVGWTAARPDYMDWQQLRELFAQGHAIGAHGWSHKLLTHCSSAELDQELVRARATLEDRLGVSITTMSLPGGRANGRVFAACAAAGFAHVYTSVPRPEPIEPSTIVGRLNLHGDAQPAWLARILDPSDPALLRQTRSSRVKAAAQTVLGDRLYASLWKLVNRKEDDAEDAAYTPTSDRGRSA